LNIDADGGINRANAVFINESRIDEFENFALQTWDTLFVMVGATLGKCGLVRESDLPALLNQNMWRIRADRELVEPRFLYYVFSAASQKLLSYASGAARDFVRRDDYRNLSLKIPPLSEQRAIAEVLGALDDKIESNHRKAALLRRLIGAIYEDQESQATEFEPLTNLAALTKGTEPGRDNCNEEKLGIPFIRVGDLNRDEVTLYTTSNECECADEDSVLVSFDGTPGRVATAMSGAFSSGIRRADPRNSDVSSGLLLAVLESASTQRTIAEYATGTTILHAGAAVPHIRVPLLGQLQIRELSVELENLRRVIVASTRETRSLQKLRKTLLPELLSGRLRVSDAEKIVEEAV